MSNKHIKDYQHHQLSEHANFTHDETLLHTHWNGYKLKRLIIPSVGENVGQHALLYTADIPALENRWAGLIHSNIQQSTAQEFHPQVLTQEKLKHVSIQSSEQFHSQKPQIGNNSNIQHQVKNPTQKARPFNGIPVTNKTGVSWTFASRCDGGIGNRQIFLKQLENQPKYMEQRFSDIGQQVAQDGDSTEKGS